MIKLYSLFLAIVFFLTPILMNAAGDPLVAYQVNGKWHIIDDEGSELFPPLDVYEIGGYSEGYIRTYEEINDQKKWAFRNLKGERSIVVESDAVKDFLEGKAITINFLDQKGINREMGMIDTSGKEFLPMKYKDIIPFKEGLAYIMNDFERGYIDHEKNMVIELKNTTGYPFYNGLAAVSNMNHKVGYMNKKGELLIPFSFDEPHEYSEGLIGLNQGEFFGYIDSNGIKVIDFKYHDAKPFKDGRAFVAKMNMNHEYVYGMIDKAGTMLIDYKYKYVQDFSEGFAVVSEDGKFGFIDTMGQPVFGSDHTFCAPFVNGLAWVSDHEEGNYGFIDKTGKYVVKIPKADAIIDLRLNVPLF